MDKAAERASTGFWPVRVSAALGVFHQRVAHRIDIQVAFRPRCRERSRRQRVPTRIVFSSCRIVFLTPVDDKYRADLVSRTRRLVAQLRFRVVYNNAKPFGIKNCRNNDTGSFTGSRRRTTQGWQRFFQFQHFTLKLADHHTKTVKSEQRHFFNIAQSSNVRRPVNIRLEFIRTLYAADNQNQRKRNKRQNRRP